MITVARNPEGQITEVTSEHRAGGENRNDWRTFAKVQGHTYTQNPSF